MTQSLEGVTELGQGDPCALVTLPYWAWINKQAPAMQILLEARGLNEFDFTWPLIKENLHLCTCVFSGRRLEITPPCLPIHTIPSFIQARRRIYMTATLSDDSVLISHFNADISSVQQPITPPPLARLSWPARPLSAASWPRSGPSVSDHRAARCRH